MKTKCPWYISAGAVRDYLRLSGRRVEDGGPDWDWAEGELMRMASALAQRFYPLGLKRNENGLLVYDEGRPRRWRFLVSDVTRPEGPLPQLVAVTMRHVPKTR